MVPAWGDSTCWHTGVAAGAAGRGRCDLASTMFGVKSEAVGTAACKPLTRIRTSSVNEHMLLFMDN